MNKNPNIGDIVIANFGSWQYFLLLHEFDTKLNSYIGIIINSTNPNRTLVGAEVGTKMWLHTSQYNVAWFNEEDVIR